MKLGVWLAISMLSVVVRKNLSSAQFVGWKAFSLKEKLKSLKGALRHWNHLVFGNVDVNIKNCTSEIDALEARAGEVGLSPDELMARCNLMAKLWKSLLDKDSLLREKSRLKWIQDEDVNSSYLHAYLARRRNRNKICALRGHGSWVHGVDAIKDVIKNHFHHHFSEAHIVRPTLDGIGFPQVGGVIGLKIVLP
ncbi:hypothetical protein RIF29_08713 [Crotalaria pallida]|uniref:Uncharacterized protein n=1 Tax=Crotalaria pallida TaxID=3830 RepID=A0AAN9FXD7_CROPI